MPADNRLALRCWDTLVFTSPHLTCPGKASAKELILPHAFAQFPGTGYLNRADRLQPLSFGTGNISPAMGTLFFPFVLFLLDPSHLLEQVLNLVLSGCIVLQ